MKKNLVILTSLLIISLLTACGGAGRITESPTANEIQTEKQSSQESLTTTAEASTTETTTVFTEISTESETSAAANKTEFMIGETWTVDGLWALTVLGATETEDRNPFSEKNPAAVYIVDYSYTNLGYEDSFMDGLYFSLDDMIVDAAGKMGYSYPGTITNYPLETPIGATCNAQACIGVDNAGTFSITLNEYDAKFNKYSAKFVIDPTLPYAEYIPQAGSIDNSSALKIGETWAVDGLWTLTITGVSSTDERNQFSDKNPAAVYIVDYSYTNIGYEDNFMDGLYMTIEDMIVDAAGKMGYSYPGTITNYPLETPIGATCDAQACIGVDNAGSFTITVSYYDNAYNKYSQTFLVNID